MIRQSFAKDSDGQRIPLYDDADFHAMDKAGKLAAKTLDYITPYVKKGVSTGELDDLCHQFIRDHGAIPAPLGYRGFPKPTCISVNHVICHGIPSHSKLLKDGDILNIDVTVILDGWHGDTSRMFKVGKISTIAERLINVTQECLNLAIEAVKPGAKLGDLGHAITTHAHKNRFSVVEDFCGHGVGKTFHAPPSVLHHGKKGTGVTLQKGMIFTIEPMINQGTHKAKVMKDGWTAITQDRKLSAQFEHTIGVTDDGCHVFTHG